MFRAIWVPQVLTLTKQALHLPLRPSWSQVPPSGFSFSTTESPLTLAIQSQYCPSPNAGQSVPFSPPPEDFGAWRPHSWVLLEAAGRNKGTSTAGVSGLPWGRVTALHWVVLLLWPKEKLLCFVSWDAPHSHTPAPPCPQSVLLPWRQQF